ncbi:DUF3037 domain-containing protein [Dyadobacter fermentans]|uniref:DUF3037 domain-containing protein n=1 Tax=Dyadobacter fermentans (strain ATCC 700827 / DSM 18053 / CIP 107007 / KCTC 52180 / NS114) TaxID=471854 RepID=C6VVW2_DYAFD|nr:DUF3037 domain-containing protein [Dyadobacter fermentans]ACT91418.1 conserved hypothetical protein [Dyadobacter fermentans DSM 18053]
MSDKFLYEYAVLRIVPRVEREEFINAGVVLYCPSRGFLSCCIELDPQRLRALCAETDPAEVQAYLDAFRQICVGNRQCGSPIAALPAASRFRWLTATRSTVLQTSRVHPGFCTDPGETLRMLFEQQVK